MTDEKRPLKVFLCHASADKPKVRELYRYLKRRGLQPWLDAENLLPGQAWQVEIPKALETSDAIIICLSKGSVDKEGYVQKEIKFALDKALEMPEGRIFLIPARLEECDVPRSLSTYHWVDLFDEGGHEKLMKSLKLRATQLQRSNVKTSKADETKRDLPSKPEPEQIKNDVAQPMLENVGDKKAPVSVEQKKTEKQELRMFYDLRYHYEHDIPNVDAEVVAKNLLEIFTRILRYADIKDNDENIAIKYVFDSVEYFDPKEGKTLQHALIIHGEKYLPDKDKNPNLIYPTKVQELLIITITQDIHSARLRFDSDKLHPRVFSQYVQMVLRELGIPAPVASSNSENKSENIEQTEKPKSNPEKPSRKLKTKYIIAVIGAAATLLAVLIGILPQIIKPTPTMPSAIVKDTISVTKTPTASFTVLPPSSTPKPNNTPTATLRFTTQISRPTSYTLHEGEFPHCIARRFDVNPDELLALNGLPVDGQTYYGGLTLRIPQSGNRFPGVRSLKLHPAKYVVQSGDTIYSIACLFADVDPMAIVSANNLGGANGLTTGATIQIP